MITEREKFGKVFISSSEDSKEKDSLSLSWRELHFACFSNSDLIWYGADGEIHDQFIKYHGYEFSLEFKITEETKPGIKETFVGRLNTGCCLGAPQKFQGSTSCILGNTSSPFAIDNPVINKLIEVDHLNTLARFISPSGNYSNRKLLYNVLPCVFSESLKNTETILKMKLPHSQISTITDAILRKATGEGDSKTNGGITSLLGAITPAALRLVKLSQLRVLQQSFQLTGQLAMEIRDEALKITEGNEKVLQPFIQSVVSTFHQGCLKNCLEFQETKFPSKSEFAPDLNYESRGYQIILEAVALEAGILLEANICETFLFRRFIYHFVKQMGKIHDIFSMKPEQVSSSQRTFQEIMRNLVQEANDNLQELLIISELLENVFDCGHSNRCNPKGLEGGVSRYTRVARQITLGFIQWQGYRHPDVVFDCYVSSKSRDREID